MADELMVLMLLWVVMTSGFSIAFLSLHFKNRRLSHEIQRLEAENDSLIHRVEVQREMLVSRLSPETEKKVTEAAGYMAEVFRLGTWIQNVIKAKKLEREKKTQQ